MKNKINYSPTLSIVIPAYNEEKTIAKVLSRIQVALNPFLQSYEVIVVDDGSTDDTAKIAKRFGVKVVSQTNSGYGAALKTGLFKAKGKYLCFIDADNTYPPEAIVPMLLNAKSYSLVVGSRFSRPKNGMPKIRRIGNKLFAISVTILCGAKTSDVWSGLRIFDRKLLSLVTNLPENLTFTPTMTLRTILQGFSYIELDIPYAEREGDSKLNVAKDGYRFLKTMLLEVVTYNRNNCS